MNRDIVVIAGASGAVGAATADIFMREGYRVASLSRHKSIGDISIVCDTTDENAVREAFAAIEREGRIVACIYAASDRIVRKRLQEMTEREFRTHFEANVVGAFNVLTAAARGMRKPGSALIGITSVVLYEDATPARMGAYAIAKAAQQMLLREMHRECSHEGVRVFGIAPGLMKTALTADLPDKYFEFAAARGTRLTTPEEVAQAALDCVSSKRAGGVSLDMRDNAERPL